MFNLSPRVRILNAAFFSGRHGTVTQHAELAACHLKTAYDHAHKVEGQWPGSSAWTGRWPDISDRVLEIDFGIVNHSSLKHAKFIRARRFYRNHLISPSHLIEGACPSSFALDSGRADESR